MTKIQIIDYQPATDALRVHHALTKEIKAPSQKIFQLACPVEELRWIPDWEYQLIYSESGTNETHCIFNEEKSGPVFFSKPYTTTWTTILYDPDHLRIRFHLSIETKASIAFNIAIDDVGPHISRVTWNLTFTGLDQEANEMNEKEIHEKLGFVTGFLSESLKHYCETGKIIS